MIYAIVHFLESAELPARSRGRQPGIVAADVARIWGVEVLIPGFFN